VDWRAKGKVSSPADQGLCGGCWAFAAAALLESLNAIENNLEECPVYSVQYLMDCDKIDVGCDGGWMLDTFDWTKENGIIPWTSYPKGWMGDITRCEKVEKEVPRWYNHGGMEEDNVSNERMKELLVKQPIGAAMYTNYGCMNFYKNGILTEADCECSDPNVHDVTHAVTVIGYGVSEFPGCKEYWLVRNSWGPVWGDKGSFRLCADREGPTAKYGTCQINSYIMWPTL
jgi:C1A family cysteine protease